MAEVERTDAAMGVMNDSISSLGNINDEFGGSMKSGEEEGRTRKGQYRWFRSSVWDVNVRSFCWRTRPAKYGEKVALDAPRFLTFSMTVTGIC